MGAATSVLVAARDPSIAGMVLDSAFSSLTQVMYELANQYMKQVKVPKILINGAISVLRKSVQKKGNFDIRDVNPEEAADKCFIPVCVCVVAADKCFILVWGWGYCRWLAVVWW